MTSRRPQAAVLVDLALARWDMGLSARGEPFAVPQGGPSIAAMLRGSGGSLRARLAAVYLGQTGGVPSATALTDALACLEGLALAAEPTPLYLRRARTADGLQVDLGRGDGLAAHVTPAGWKIAPPTVVFRRTALTGPLPDPQPGGDLADLRRFLHVDDAAWPLVAGFAVSAALGAGPVPALLLLGEQGSAKSSAARIIVDLIDPSPAALRSAPRDIHEWSVVADASDMLAIDNVSTLPPWLSDALCRAVTGDSFPKRRLYSDGEIVLAAFRRSLVLTSIDLGGLRGDLADRLALVELQPIPEHQRRTDEELASGWQAARPGVLGALLDTLAAVLGELDRGPEPVTLPRMADHGRTLAALDRATGWQTLPAYLESVEGLAAQAVEGDPVAAAVVRLAANGGWQGTASDLLAMLSPEQPGRGWPSTPHHLSGRLRRAAPGLRRAGIEVSLPPAGAGPSARTLAIGRAPAEPEQATLADLGGPA